MGGPVKLCACGRSFTRAQWGALPYVGQHGIPATIDEATILLELRECPCGSTITIDLLAPGAPAGEKGRP